MSDEKDKERWQRSGLTEPERSSLMGVYNRLEIDMRPVVVEYLKSKRTTSELFEVLNDATNKGTGLLMALGHTFEEARAIISLWDETKKPKRKK
jgi:hypothetical protein